jgi:hypothetical protein
MLTSLLKLTFIKVKVKVTLRLTVSQSVCLGVKPKSGTFDQIFLIKVTFISIACCVYTKMSALIRRAIKHAAWVTWPNSALPSHLMTSLQFGYIRPVSPGWLGGSLSV